MVCQVKLSNGLMVHGPQCQSENDAKEKAAFFALQRLVQHTWEINHKSLLFQCNANKRIRLFY